METSKHYAKPRPSLFQVASISRERSIERSTVSSAFRQKVCLSITSCRPFNISDRQHKSAFNLKTYKMEQYLPFVAHHWQQITLVCVSLLLGVTVEKWLSSKSVGNKIDEKSLSLKSQANKKLERKEEVDEDSTEDVADADEVAPVNVEEECPRISYNYSRPTVEESVSHSLKFYQLMNKRRSVRHISADHVPIEIIRNIILTGGKRNFGQLHSSHVIVVIAGNEATTDYCGLTLGFNSPKNSTSSSEGLFTQKNPRTPPTKSEKNPKNPRIFLRI